jgi:hypothetical protein
MCRRPPWQDTKQFVKRLTRAGITLGDLNDLFSVLIGEDILSGNLERAITNRLLLPFLEIVGEHRKIFVIDITKPAHRLAVATEYDSRGL